jgi:glutaredoxin-like protein
MSTQADEVVVYTRPGCPYSMLLRLGMRRTGLQHTEVDIWQDPQAAAFVRSVADGNETVPTVTIGGTAMVNPSTQQVMAAVAQHAPHLLPPSDAKPRRLGLRRRDAGQDDSS